MQETIASPYDLRVIRLSDYRPPLWFVRECHLEIDLDEQRTQVISVLHMTCNSSNNKTCNSPTRNTPNNSSDNKSDAFDIILDGENLELEAVYLDGKKLSSHEYKQDSKQLVIPFNGNYNCTIKTICLINPGANSELSGLYRSGNFYCTQCEPEGFRRITYFPDRPDVMCLFQVKITATAKGNTYLLSNGNLIESGLSKDGKKRYANWQLPMPIPCYLFALVGGDFDVLVDQYITQKSGKKIELLIYTEKGKKNRASFAMESLKRAMLWDEKIYGFEYDLQCFMIVAVSDFNMGAMENKGINIFNDKYLLADKDHASDKDYQNIDRIVAHEYFHNWTGNRITCRDWFQICLKEGLTVFREQQYCASQTSEPVERIKNIRLLRKTQFIDDKGPLAHPVRPTQYSEINNFYNTTVYEKGAEIFRMIKIILGEKGYYEGIKNFFKNHDGKAATVEDILESMAQANPQYQELLQKNMLRWYQQAGTPELKIQTEYLKHNQQYKLKIIQNLPKNNNIKTPKPQPMPIKIALLDNSGKEIENLKIHSIEGGETKNNLIIMQQKQLDIVFDDIQSSPYLSIMRGFPAPVMLDYEQSDETLAFLSLYDSDICNRWQALHQLSLRYLISSLDEKIQTLATRTNRANRATKTTRTTRDILLDCYDKILCEQIELDSKQLLLTPPSYQDIVLAMEKNICPNKTVNAIEKLYLLIGQKLEKNLKKQYLQLTQKLEKIKYQPHQSDMKIRGYKNYLLFLLAKANPHQIEKHAEEIYLKTDNLTDKLAVLEAVNNIKGSVRNKLLDILINPNQQKQSPNKQFSVDNMLIDKYLSLQARLQTKDSAEHIRKIMQNEYFKIKKPNHIFSLLGTFIAANHVGFHNEDESGYLLIAQLVVQIDSFNPQVAARLMSGFSAINTLIPCLQEKICKRVKLIVNNHKTSINVREIGIKILQSTK